ncbi:unnamed protein product [Rhizoctonia solani]|uniref:Ricin B lectin domain-containing protein n=1 Tax=Rhizoctonia solani TaxID=456999 RepID=A0A8H2XYP6_9AGAM|nr:unnamed protein product [Rhizoctonia solani]
MGIQGNFMIMNLEGFCLFTPPGAGESFPGPPLQVMPQGVPPAIIHIQDLGGDKYKLTPVQHRSHCIGAFPGGSPKLLHLFPQGQGQDEFTEWAIEPAGNGEYEIHTTSGPGNENWTAQGGPGGMIELQPAVGEPGQRWRIVQTSQD